MPRVSHPISPAWARSDERVFRLGDRVRYGGSVGTVVANISIGEYASPADRHIWADLGAGVVVRWNDRALGHFREPDCNLLRAHSRVPGGSSASGPLSRNDFEKAPLTAVR